MTTTTLAAPTHSSPLDPVFAGHTEIPLAFREQFFHAEELPYGMRLEGVMHGVWHRPRALGPVFRLLGRIGILVPETGEEVPTTLTVRPGRNRRDGIYHVWDRTFAFARPVRFRTTIIYDPRIGQVVDLVGPRDWLYMVWKARFHAPDRFTLDTEACAFRINGRTLWMPAWLWKLLLGTVTFSQVADSMEGDTVRIDLLITHPVLGRIFGYTGTFRTVRTPKEDERIAAESSVSAEIGPRPRGAPSPGLSPKNLGRGDGLRQAVETRSNSPLSARNERGGAGGGAPRTRTDAR